MTRRVGSLRRAGSADLPSLVELWIEVARHHAELDPLFTLRPDAATEVRRLLAAEIASDRSRIFVWDAPEGLLGFCSVRVDQAPAIFTETRRAEITDLGVTPAARRRGVGRSLAEAALHWAAGRGVERVEVRVAATNREGQAFWRELGFGPLMDVLQRRL